MYYQDELETVIKYLYIGQAASTLNHESYARRKTCITKGIRLQVKYWLLWSVKERLRKTGGYSKYGLESRFEIGGTASKFY